MKIFILILNFNDKKDTVECLRSLKNIEASIKIVVIDNGSTDGSIEEINKYFPKVKIVDNKKNLGFAAGNNVGIRYALKEGADKIIILNTDAFLTPFSFSYLLENVGDVVGPVLEFQREGKIVYDLGGHINWWLGRTTHEEVETKKDIAHRNPDYVSGAAMLIKRQVFERIGLLDDRYFLYYEDADFCSRAKKSGFTIAIEPNAIIYHKLGASSGRHSTTTLYHNLRSNLLFINKNLIWWRKPIGWIYWLFLSIKVVINWLLVK